MPTLSVCITALNEHDRLPTQLRAILSQLHDDDEIVALDDGSKDDTIKIFRDHLRPQDRLLCSIVPSGVCAAFNRVASCASKEYIHCVSANDEVLPGAYDEFRLAASRYKQAKIFFGDIEQWPALDWLPTTGFLLRNQIHQVFYSKRGWHTHGAAVFIKRDVWGQGYPPALRYTADWWQAFILALRHGCVYVRKPISRVNFSIGSFSQEHSDREKYNAVIREMHDMMYRDEYSDVRESLQKYDEVTHWLRLR